MTTTSMRLSADALTPIVGHEVASVTVEPVGTGQVASSLRVTLTYADPHAAAAAGAPATVVAKVPSEDPATRASSQLLNTYGIETSFYRELAATLRVTVPRCFHAEHDPVTDDFLLVLEDLAPAVQGDQIAGCSLDEAAAAVDQLVGMHAPRWGDATLGAIGWLARSNQFTVEFHAQLLGQLFDGFEQRYAGRVDDEVLRLARQAIPTLPAVTMAEVASWGVVHGDFRPDNLLFRPTDGTPSVTVVDWQTVLYGPSVSDLSYFIGGALLPEARRTHEAELVRLYRQQMAAQGVTLDWDQLWLWYRRHTMAGLVMAVGASMVVEQTERGDDMFVAMANRHGHHALELDYLGAVPT